jgi:hypothetical protein
LATLYLQQVEDKIEGLQQEKLFLIQEKYELKSLMKSK